MSESKPGPWLAKKHEGTSGARYFAVQRDNPKAWGFVEVMLSKSGTPRRFGTLQAAQKVADEANAAIAAAIGDQP